MVFTYLSLMKSTNRRSYLQEIDGIYPGSELTMDTLISLG